MTASTPTSELSSACACAWRERLRVERRERRAHERAESGDLVEQQGEQRVRDLHDGADRRDQHEVAPVQRERRVEPLADRHRPEPAGADLGRHGPGVPAGLRRAPPAGPIRAAARPSPEAVRPSRRWRAPSGRRRSPARAVALPSPPAESPSLAARRPDRCGRRLRRRLIGHDNHCGCCNPSGEQRYPG